MPEVPAPSGPHTTLRFEPSLSNSAIQESLGHSGDFQPALAAAQSGKQSVGSEGSQHGIRPNGNLASFTSEASLNRRVGASGSIPWSNTDRIAAQVQALLSKCPQYQTAMPQAKRVKLEPGTETSSHLRNLPTYQTATTTNVRATLPPNMPSMSGSAPSFQPVQPLTRALPGPSSSTTPGLQWNASQTTKEQMGWGQTYLGTLNVLPPQTESTELSHSARSSLGSSSTASSDGWTPDLQLAIETSSQMQAALGLVDIAPYVPRSTVGAPAPARDFHAYNGNESTTGNNAGNVTTAVHGSYGKPAQQNSNHAVMGQDGQQTYGGSMDTRPWFH